MTKKKPLKRLLSSRLFSSLHLLYPVRPLQSEGDERVFTLCQACVFLSISIQLQQKGSPELPLIGRTGREELVCLTVEPRVHRVLAEGEKKHQFTRKLQSSRKNRPNMV